MKKFIFSAIRNPLISGSTVIFVGMMMANILNYMFSLGMGRFLSPADYGTLISLVSVFNFFSVFSITIGTVFAKFAAVFVGQKKESLIGPLFISGSLWVGIMSFVVCGLIIIFSHRLSQFLNNVPVILIIIIASSLLFSYLSYVGLGILQGLLKFGYASFINIFSSFVKLIIGFILVFLGFKVLGAISAFFLSLALSYLLVFFPLLKFLKNKNKNFSIRDLRKKIYLYSLPVFLSNIGITAFITIDVILVKHFFNPIIAGQYAAVSIIGRSIFYAVAPVATVMFSLVAQKKERGESPTGIILLSMLLVGLPAIVMGIIYFVFPDIIRLIFFPNDYKIIDQYLGPFSIFILFYTLSYLLNLFYLSIGKISICVITILGAIFEVLLIYLFHKDISQVIAGLIISSFLLLCFLLLYYPKATKSSKF